MENLLSPKEIKEQVQKFESTLFAVRKFLESARRVGLPAWQLDIKEIEILVADFEGELLGVSNFQRELEAKQPEFEALRAVGMELGERAKKLEIHNQADYEEYLRLRAELTAHKELIEAKYAALIEALEQRYHRLLTAQQRLLALCRVDTEGSA
jgi:hypothetical protein